MARTEGTRIILESNNIDLREIFSVERILAARGFFVGKQANHKQTILNDSNPEATAIKWLYDSFHNPVKRLELKNSSELNQVVEWPINAQLSQVRFASSLEWYISELLIKEFHSFSSSFGVELQNTRNPRNGLELGDFDVLSVMGDTNLLYVECKSGGTSKSQIVKAVERGNSLFAIANVVTLSHKSLFEALRHELDQTPYPGLDGVTVPLRKINVAGLPSSLVFTWHNTYFLPRSDINIAEGLTTILRLIALSRVELIKATASSDDDFRRLGFVIC